MNKRHSYIAAGALALAGMAGMASWLAFEAGELNMQPPSYVEQTAGVEPGVSETEAVLPALPAADYAPAPSGSVPVAAAIGGVVPVVRASRTPIAAPRRATVSTPERAEPAPAPVERRTEPVESIEPAEPALLEVTVPANAVLGVRLSTSLTSDTAKVEDRVEASVTRDVIADGRVAIPAGTKLLGSVNEVTRGGKFKERARLSVRFHTLVLADGTREAVRVDSIVREGDSPARASAAKIGGGAVGGAIIGGIMGGKKGAIFGGAAGAGAGTAAVAAGDRSMATLTAGSPLSVRLDSPVTVTIKRDR